MKLWIVILVIIMIIIFLNMKTYEHFTDLSNEAIQNIASVYNKDNMTLTNLTTTGDITIGGKIDTTGNITTKENISGKNMTLGSGEHYLSGLITNENNVEKTQLAMIGKKSKFWVGPVDEKIDFWSSGGKTFNFGATGVDAQFNFSGNTKITKDIVVGGKIDATGNITTKGNFSGGKIDASGDITTKGLITANSINIL